MLKTTFAKPDWFALATACLLSLFSLVSLSFHLSESFALLTEGPFSIGVSLLAFLVLSAIAYLILAAFFMWLDRNTAHDGDLPFSTVLRKRFLVVFAIIMICWLPWMISHYPGLMRDDSVRQLFQTYAVEPYSNGNPLFDTWVFGLFWHLGDALGNRALGLYLFGFFQGTLTAASLAFMLCYLIKIRVPKAVVALSLAAIALLSIFPLSAISMSKDGFNGWAFTLFFVLYVELCRTKGTILHRKGFVAAFAAVTLLTIATKKTMLYVVLIAFLAFILFNKNTRVRAAITFIPVILASVLLCDTLIPRMMTNDAPTPLPPAMAETAPEDETYGSESQHQNDEPKLPAIGGTFLIIPLQQTGHVLAQGLEISDSDYEALSRYVDCEKTKATFNPHRADEAVWGTVEGYDGSDQLAYLGAWLRIGMQHPTAYLEALVNQVGGWFSPFKQIAFGYDLQNDVFDDGHMALWANYFPGGAAEAAAFLEPLDDSLPAVEPLWEATTALASVEYAVRFPVSFGLWCTWLPLIGFVYALRTRHRNPSEGSILPFAVPGAVLLSLLIGPMVLYWYAIPAFYIAPLVATCGIRNPQRSA